MGYTLKASHFDILPMKDWVLKKREFRSLNSKMSIFMVYTEISVFFSPDIYYILKLKMHALVNNL